MSVTDQLLTNNISYSNTFDKGDLPLPPAKKVAVVACMDARLSPYGALGLEEGDAHVIRNAGGVVTEDEIRSLAISQHLLGTEEITLIHHTDCGRPPSPMTTSDSSSRRRLGSSLLGRLSRSLTWTKTSANRSPGSRRVLSCPARIRFGVSSMTLRRDDCERWCRR